MDRAASPPSYDNDGLCLPANTKARAGGPEKKESPDLRLSRACPPSDRPSLTEYRDLRQTNAHTAVGAYQSRIPNFCQSSARTDLSTKQTCACTDLLIPFSC